MFAIVVGEVLAEILDMASLIDKLGSTCCFQPLTIATATATTSPHHWTSLTNLHNGDFASAAKLSKNLALLLSTC